MQGDRDDRSGGGYACDRGGGRLPVDLDPVGIGPRLLVEGHATWLPEQFNGPRHPHMRSEETAAYEVVARNVGESDAVIEGWRRRPQCHHLVPAAR
jgi:hypothetical protein